MARKSVNASVDRKVFQHTATTRKRINLARPTTFRGGIRL